MEEAFGALESPVVQNVPLVLKTLYLEELKDVNRSTFP